MRLKGWGDWTLRFVKGIFIGSGFILPGVSGGALAAVFGIYERMIGFIANITKNFGKNVIFFLPVGLGGMFGIFLLSFAVSYFLDAYEVQILWFFIGCILGTLPALWKQAGKRGREVSHLAILGVSAVVGYGVLAWGESAVAGPLRQNLPVWLGAGGIIGLGAVIPGLSPSNFLVYFGLYEPMTNGIKSLDLTVILPVAVGAAASVLVLAKGMERLFQRAYAGLFHFILGVVAASTVMIVPTGIGYTGLLAGVCFLCCGGGAALGYWMSTLEERYKQEETV